MSQSADPTVRKFTGRHMLALIVVFFAVIIGANMTLAYFALGSWTGLVVKNSYVASQKFNAELAQRRASEKAGWRLRVVERSGALTIHVRGVSDRPVSGLALEVFAQRPVHEHADRILHLTPVDTGVYRAAETLDTGVWNLKVTMSDGQQTLDRFVRIVVGKGA